jgi:tetratricopeptide (TPR) repeat protein
MLSFTTYAYWCYPLQGQNFLCKGMFEKAAECFQKAIELQPLDAVW